MPEETNQTVIYLQPQDALLFVEFQKRYAFMELLQSIDAFKLKSGSITIHFDSEGQIASIEKKQHYKP